MTIEWIKELCPEVAEWQAELIAEHIEGRVAAEREACAKVCEAFGKTLEVDAGSNHAIRMMSSIFAEAIRARGGE